VKFGAFEVDLEAGELRKSGMRLKLAGQPFQVLQFLLEHPQEIVTREQLQKHVWSQDTFVDYDLALKKAINRIRDVLGDSAESPRFIETVPRRGYRFIAPLTLNGDAGVRADLPTDATSARNLWSRRSLRIGIALGVGAGVLLVGILALIPAESWRSPKAAVPQIRSLAVLPLQNLSADPAQEYFSDGMTDALITDLAQIGSVKVISRTSSMQYKQTRKSLPEIARELNVDGIVEGTVQRSGERVRITAQLIHGPSDKHLWANSYERETRDLLALERDVTSDIAHQVQARLTPRNEISPGQPRPVDLKALEAYLQGNYHLHRFSRGSGDEQKRQASHYFQQAIDADPSFALAYSGMAEAHYNLLQSSREDVAVVIRAAQRAVELDPTLSDAWVTLAHLKFEIKWDWPGAEQDFRRAIALNPNNARAHYCFADLLHAMGQLDEGWSESQVAQSLDPLNNHLSWAFEWQGHYDRAIELLVKMTESHPDDGYLHTDLYRCYGKTGKYKESIQELETAATLFGLRETAARIHHAFAVGGYRAAMREWAEELERMATTKQVFAPVNIAEGYAAAGDNDRAFYWLERAYTDREVIGTDVPLPLIKLALLLEPLHRDPRYQDLLRRIGLPP
jgi:TolB-like protein/DNA-binding winged helix-turn-helix (wHTH) protein/tetratricopeptide (TPR) repeat protein